MFEDLDTLPATAKGSLAQTPLEELFEAIFRTQRTCSLHLKRHAFERTIAFERGLPVGCTSNLVQDSLGRALVEKKLLKEEDYQALLNASAERSMRFETALAESKLLEAQTLERHLHLNLAQRILDCFRWTDASFSLLGEVEIDPNPLRINLGQLLFRAICSALPEGVVPSRFPVAEGQRWAATHRSRHSVDELKLSAKDAAILDALAARPTFAELCGRIDEEPEVVRRRLYAFALLGLADHSEKVPASVPEEISPANPRHSRARTFAAALLGAGVCTAMGAAIALRSAPGPSAPPPLVLKAPRAKPAGTHQTLGVPRPLPPAPAGARARPDRPRGLHLSASGIAFEPPAPGPSVAAGKVDAASKLLRLGRREAALDLYERALEAAPQSADAAFGAALALYESGRDDVARAAAESALALDPDHAQAHLLLGYLEQMSGRAAEAVAHYRRCAELAQSSPQGKDVGELADRLEAKPEPNPPPGVAQKVLQVGSADR